jgi:hypothetical protein
LSCFAYLLTYQYPFKVNVEVDYGKNDKTAAAQNFVNEDRALMRFEYLEAFVRIAVNKYKVSSACLS